MVRVVEDVVILCGLGLIYLIMLAMIITLGRFFVGEEHAPGERRSKPSGVTDRRV